MPVLPPAYLSSLQKVSIGNNTYILEKFNLQQLNSLSDKQMIQGSLGVRVMDVGELYWKSQIDSTALIYENGLNTDIFALLTLLWANVTNVNTGAVPLQPLLEKATINITKDAVKCNLNLKSDLPTYFSIVTGGATEPIARTAKWYDCTLTINNGPIGFGGTSTSTINNGPIGLGGTSTSVGIESAEIELETKINQRYFIGQGQTPFFSIESYKISGRITILASPADMLNVANLIPFQNRGGLVRTGASSLVLNIGGVNLYIGLAAMNSDYTRTIQAGDVNKITVSFTSYTS
jgi:hypothetical protein